MAFQTDVCRLCTNQTQLIIGHGKLSMADGSYYKGTFVNGEIEGHGFRLFAINGGTYSGQFHQGEMNGQGIYKSPQGLHYEGSWQDNKREGTNNYKRCNCHISHTQGRVSSLNLMDRFTMVTFTTTRDMAKEYKFICMNSNHLIALFLSLLYTVMVTVMKENGYKTRDKVKACVVWQMGRCMM